MILITLWVVGVGIGSIRFGKAIFGQLIETVG